MSDRSQLDLIGGDELGSLNSVFAPFFESQIRAAAAHKSQIQMLRRDNGNGYSINMRTLFDDIWRLFRAFIPSTYIHDDHL